MSSISGSESDTSDDVNEVGVTGKGVRVQGSPLLVFTGPDGTNHALYRCLLAGPKVRYHGYVHVHGILVDA